MFPLRRVVRFVDGLSAEQVEAASRSLLQGFFESLNVQTVCLARSSVTLDTAKAVGECSRRLAALKPIPRGSRGIFFDLDKDKKQESHWSLFLHRGPLPMLDLEIEMSLSAKFTDTVLLNRLYDLSEPGMHTVQLEQQRDCQIIRCRRTTDR